MATLKTRISFELKIGNHVWKGGDATTDLSTTVTGEVHDIKLAITNSSGDDYNAEIAWATTEGGVDTFDFIYIESDQDVLVEFQTTDGDFHCAVIQVLAGMPVFLNSDLLVVEDDTAFEVVNGTQTTAATVIDTITVQNNTTGATTANTANVRIVLID